MTPILLPIVEGHSEVRGVPILLRRLFIYLGRPEAQVTRPFRVTRDRILLSGEIERAVIRGLQIKSGITGVLVLLDADDDDPEQIEASLLKRCQAVRSLPVAVVAAKRELESWFLGSKESLRGICGIRTSANAPEDPESIRGAKERLSRNMEGNRHYVEVSDQPVLAASMDLGLAMERCLSFRKLVSELERILVESA